MQACLFIIKLSFVKRLLEANQECCVPMVVYKKNRFSACVVVQVRYHEKKTFFVTHNYYVYSICVATREWVTTQGAHPMIYSPAPKFTRKHGRGGGAMSRNTHEECVQIIIGMHNGPYDRWVRIGFPGHTCITNVPSARPLFHY